MPGPRRVADELLRPPVRHSEQGSDVADGEAFVRQAAGEAAADGDGVHRHTLGVSASDSGSVEEFVNPVVDRKIHDDARRTARVRGEGVEEATGDLLDLGEPAGACGAPKLRDADEPRRAIAPAGRDVDVQGTVVLPGGFGTAHLAP